MKPGDIIDATINVPIKIMMLPDAEHGYLCMRIRDTVAFVREGNVDIGSIGGAIGGSTYMSVTDGPSLSISAEGMWDALIKFCLDNELLEEDWLKKRLEKNEKDLENID